MQRTLSQPKQGAPNYGSERDVEKLTGIKVATLQKHRLFRTGFPFYKFGGKVIYDLNEVQDIIRAGRVNTTEAA
ncbi:hypothetical protein F183_A29790 [Bryobacterales bacterium F-183]|nr:hypothetical protein F183_A29790 [Bryobacterales bacterium F-183]